MPSHTIDDKVASEPVKHSVPEKTYSHFSSLQYAALPFIVAASAYLGIAGNAVADTVAFVSDRGGNFDIWTMNSDRGNPINLTNNPAYDMHPAGSPDGSLIAFSSDRTGLSEIYVMDADGNNQVRLTNLPEGVFYNNFGPTWTLGNNILFYSDRDGNYEIYSMRADGSGQKNLTNHPAQDLLPTYTAGSLGILNSNGLPVTWGAIKAGIERIGYGSSR